MSDIFISYAASDRPRLRPLVHALEKHGWSVWWDRQIPPGKTFDQVIEEALSSARCVIVLWSAESVRSEWVKTEAAEAAQRGVLVPVLIDDVKIPLEFRRIQAARLVGWQGDASHPEFVQLRGAILTLLGRIPQEGVRRALFSDLRASHEPPTRLQEQEEQIAARQSGEAQEGKQPERPPRNTRPAFWRQFAGGTLVAVLAMLIWEGRSLLFRHEAKREELTAPVTTVQPLQQEQQTVSPDTEPKENPRPQGEVAQQEDRPAMSSEVKASAQTMVSLAKPPSQQPEEKIRKEKELLAKAEKQIAKGRLTSPAGDNALETYQAILRASPQHEQANAGMRRIYERYRQWAAAAEQAEKWATARAHYEKALAIAPEEAILVAALQRVKDQEKLAAERAAQERQEQKEAGKASTQKSPASAIQSVKSDEAQNGGQSSALVLVEKKSPSTTDPAEQVAALLRAAEQGRVETVKRLLANNAPADARDAQSKTALMRAAAAGHLTVVELLLAGGADTDAKNVGGGTALMYAAWNGHLSIARALLAKGADVNARDDDGWTALIDAARNGHTEIVRLLLAHGTDVHVKSKDGETALSEAKAKNHNDIVALLTQAEARR